jgi:hypothetical protein
MKANLTQICPRVPPSQTVSIDAVDIQDGPRTVSSVKCKINNITDKTCYDEADHIFVADFTLLKGHILFQVIQGNKLSEFDNLKILVKLDV